VAQLAQVPVTVHAPAVQVSHMPLIKNKTQLSMKRRGQWHNYREPGLYMITLVVNDRKPLLGTLIEENMQACVKHSQLGKAIINEEINKISLFYPMVEVWKICVMPDHIHMILNVKTAMPPGKHLGNVVYGFKTGCTRALWRIIAEGNSSSTQPINTIQMLQTGGRVAEGFPSAMKPLLFENGYNDKILKGRDQLNRWKRYLDDNPRRLLLKRKHPDLFTVMHNVEIDNRKCKAVGNRFLLNIPQKIAVIVHRRYTDQELNSLIQKWLDTGEAGGVLVSAAVAPAEKKIMRTALERGYNIILLRENGFPPHFKPAGESFDACASGRMLIISPWEYHMGKHKITREQCLELNSLCEQIVKS